MAARWSDGKTLIRSRHGTDLTTGFPEGREFTTRWKPTTPTEAILVEPYIVAEISADTGRSHDGAWRHLFHLLRIRPDLDPTDTPLITAGNEPAAG